MHSPGPSTNPLTPSLSMLLARVSRDHTRHGTQMTGGCQKLKRRRRRHALCCARVQGDGDLIQSDLMCACCFESWQSRMYIVKCTRSMTVCTVHACGRSAVYCSVHVGGGGIFRRRYDQGWRRSSSDSSAYRLHSCDPCCHPNKSTVKSQCLRSEANTVFLLSRLSS